MFVGTYDKRTTPVITHKLEHEQFDVKSEVDIPRYKS